MVVLVKFLKRHKTAKSDLENWRILAEEMRADNVWETFPQTRFVKKNRLVFKIGDRWRIDTRVNYEKEIIFIIRLGTHEEYNKWKFED